MSTYAGKTLAELSVFAQTDPAGVRLELQARVARNGKSARNAQKALARMDQGASVAIPARPKAAPKGAKRAQVVNPNAPARLAHSTARMNARKDTPSGLSERDFFAHVAAVGRANGYSIPRWVTAGAKGRAITPKV